MCIDFYFNVCDRCLGCLCFACYNGIKLGGLETSHLILSCRNNLIIFEILCLY
ncbi:hypothetical protein HanXRQr2_Chr12g0556271 [Helianthus annuus]|uniref:Uncharacterized protein n=1 Tax=Helianthus annuus TaxID=4232 RepID=A0A9K3HIW0_HELAN|nr:hypothetical protein HanXRQr2_Chr12g0556271 [Helianthus annuus]KAJ0863918.1 hypothetical protein HanPSC8_Chr12g0535591 [Helianthus annuus]